MAKPVMVGDRLWAQPGIQRSRVWANTLANTRAELGVMGAARLWQRRYTLRDPFGNPFSPVMGAARYPPESSEAGPRAPVAPRWLRRPARRTSHRAPCFRTAHRALRLRRHPAQHRRCLSALRRRRQHAALRLRRHRAPCFRTEHRIYDRAPILLPCALLNTPKR